MAEELLKAGLGRYIAYSAAPRGAEWVAKLKAAEKYGTPFFSLLILYSYPPRSNFVLQGSKG